MAQRAQAALPPQPPALLPPPADAPPLLRACLAGDSACALELLQNGASATDTLPGGVTALHTAALGGAAGAVPALVAAGLSVDAGLEGPVQLFEVQFDRTAEAPAGTTPLALAAALGHASAVEALLAAGATHELPSLIDQHWYGSGLFENGATSPWHWVAEHIRGRDAERAAGAAAVRAQLLAHVLQRCAASAPAPQPDQLLALCVAAVLPPACTDKLAALAALPGAADLLGEVRLRRLAQSAVERGDAVVVEALQASPLRLQPLDPQGSLLEGIARKRGEDALPMARALLQVRGAGARECTRAPARVPHAAACH